MREEMENTGAIGTRAKRHKHIAELRAGRIGNHALDVVLHQADGGRKKGGRCADKHHHIHGRRRGFKQRRQTRHHEHARRYHGGGVNKSRNRGRAFHRVRQPSVEQKLRRFTHRADKQQQTDDGHRVPVEAQEVDLQR